VTLVREIRHNKVDLKVLSSSWNINKYEYVVSVKFRFDILIFINLFFFYFETREYVVNTLKM
jgi:hypothetical protein